MNCFQKTPYKKFAALGLLLITLSCTDSDQVKEDSTYQDRLNYCVSDGDCCMGKCNRELKICASSKAGAENYIAQVLFLDGSRPAQLFDVSVNQASPNLLIKEAVKVLDIDINIDAKVLFSDISNTLPGMTPSVFVYSTKFFEYDFYLLPGRYNVVLFPEGNYKNSIPVLYFNNIYVSSDGELLDENQRTLEWNIHEEKPEYYQLLSGRLVYELENKETFGLAGMRIQARDLSTNRIVSTGAISTCESSSNCGFFSIYIQPDIRPLLLEIDKPEEPFYPTYRFSTDSVANLNNSEIKIPAPNRPHLINMRIKVPMSESGGVSPVIPQTKILFSLSEDEDAVLEYQVITNDLGIAESIEGVNGVFLYPGQYNVSVYPINTGGYSFHQFGNIIDETIVISDSTDIDLELPLRQQVTGSVSFCQKPVEYVQLDQLSFNEQTPVQTSRAVRTEEDGSFMMWTDASEYLLVVQGSFLDKLASYLFFWDFSSPALASTNIELTPPYILEGKLSYEQENKADSFKDMYIKWYHLEGDKNSILVGYSKLDEQGQFTAYLPAK